MIYDRKLNHIKCGISPGRDVARHHVDGERLGMLFENRSPFWKDNGCRILNDVGKSVHLG